MQPKNHAAVLKGVVLWSLLLTAAALQQHAAYPSQSPEAAASLSVVADRFHAQDSLQTPLSGQRGYRDTSTHEHDEAERVRIPHADPSARSPSRSRTRAPHNERALATYAPADNHPAVRAPPASRSSSATTAGLTSRLPARSLQDWQVEDIVLLATVDGKLHARDRTTGAARWQLEVDTPMVETTYHRRNRSVDEHGLELEDPIWIVEPSQDGSIYMYAPGTGLGMQKLGYTVKQLADELSPYAGDGVPAVTYTAEKKSTLYTIDAGTGNILKVFSSSGSMTNDDRRCRRVDPLTSLDEDECETVGTLILGRTEYTIGVQDRNTGEQISTIKYFEWGPNNRDQDLRSKYTSTMDRKYVYSRYDGSIYGFDLASYGNHDRPHSGKPRWSSKFSSPVARVYDIVRPMDVSSGDPALVVLPQPVGPTLDELKSLEDDALDSVFVNCTESGSWYALSEANYPTVTEGARQAKCYSDDMPGMPFLPTSKAHRDRFMGVHVLYSFHQRMGTPLIGAPDHPLIDPPSDQHDEAVLPIPEKVRQSPSLAFSGLFTLLVILAGGGIAYRKSLPFSLKVVSARVEVTVPAPAVEKVEPTPVMVRAAEPAEEVIIPQTTAEASLEAASSSADNALTRTETIEDAGDEEEEVLPKDSKEKKHKRGRRGGKKQKEKEQAAAEARAAKQKGTQVPQPSEVISVNASESPEVTGPLQINSLIIHKDKLIGQGSSGTLVFEGSFEGRDVAVKRMLSQHYELALQEVSFLQQSDDHPNVIRYFCQQRDDHFLYIAVELCQASLYEVWEPEKAKNEARQQQLKALKLSIQQDAPKALHQLAAGLFHLHNLRIIHRDIKPQNILVAFPKRGQLSSGPRLVISDFGLGKNLPENVSTLNDATVNAGTSGWKAPELITQPSSDSKHSQSASQNQSDSTNGTGNGTSGVKRAADIFSLGCLFFWVLTDGLHPFEDETGWQGLRELNIKRDKKKMGELAGWSDAYEPMQLITSMLEHSPERRPTALQVLNHPFFWPPEKRLAFLCDCSDHFEREPRGTVDDNYLGDSTHLRLLEDRMKEVIEGPHHDFLRRLDASLVAEFGRQRKYSGNRLLDLLRAFRNKRNHYEDMPEHVKKLVGPLPEGYVRYFEKRFPRLLMVCFEVVQEAGLDRGDRFKGYFVAHPSP